MRTRSRGRTAPSASASAWTITAAAIALAACPLACALPAWLHRAPAFPPGERVWEVPLYEPLTDHWPRVAATVAGRAPAGGRASAAHDEVLLVVDSGSSHSALPSSTFARIGVETTTSGLATIEDAAGVKRRWSGALVPEMRLGDGLVLEDVVASVNDRAAILGADVLGAHGWQLDLDRGVLRLGGDPWPPSPDVAVIAVQPWRMHALVDARIEGPSSSVGVPLLVDTGAPFTVVDARILQGLGLPGRRLAFPWPLGAPASGSGSPVMLESTFTAALALGERRLGVRAIPALPNVGDGAARGLLGTDVLYEHAVQVAGGALRLKARPSLVASAAERIARWPEAPTCAGVPGCVVADVARTDGGAAVRVHLRFVGSWKGPMRFLFACAASSSSSSSSSSDDVAAARLPFWIQVGVARPIAGRDVDVQPAAPAALARIWAERCARLVLLDANPVLPGARPLTAEIEARPALQNRGAHLR